MKTVSYFGRIYKCLPIRYNRNKGNFRFPKGEVTMKNNRKPIFWRRGLALLLAVCLAAGYVPVPGYAEGCTHAHGEDCYEVTTQCVHSHDESCYTDPAIIEAGEEPDACAHACAEETGCVTKALNCAHVHDSACGEAAEEEPKEEPRPEPQPEGKEEPKEEPQPEGKEEPKEEPKPQEEPKEEPEAPQEPQAKTVTAWTWLDEEEALDPETGKLCLVASEEAPVFLDQIVEVLPQAIEATVDGEGETLPVAAWTCGEYPEDGAYEGSFVLEAELPEGYALGDGVEALHVTVEFGGAVTLGDCTHPTVNQTTGACESCGQVLYDAVVVTNPGTEQEQVTLYEKVSDAFAAADSINSLTEIRLLRNVTPEKVPLGFPYKTNLDGNGFTFCGGLGVNGDSPGSIENITLLKQSGQEISIQIAGDCVKLGRQCSIQGLQLDHVKTYDVVKDGFALYTDAQHTECADAATSRFTGTLYTGPHTHAYSEKSGSCDCGKTAEAKVTSGGKTTFYESVRDAISAANTGGGVVTVFEDLWFPKIDRITGSMTIDLNGFTWYTRQSDRLFTVAGRDGTEVVIQNGGIESWNRGNGAVYLQSGSLVIEGTAVLDGYRNHPAITVTGGSLTLKAGAVLLHGLKAQSGHTIGEYMAPGTAYAAYDKATGKAAEPLTLVQADVEETQQDLVIVAHTHRFDANGKCQDCGYVCSHANVNQTTGACETCGKVLYDARLTMGNTSTLYKEMNDAFQALGEGVGTVTLLRDVNTAYFYVYQNNVLDGNGHTIHGNLIIDVSAEEKSGGVIRNVTLKEGPDVIMGPQIIPVFGDNCVIYGFRTNGGELLALVQDGYAFYTDEGRTTFADPTVKKDWDVLYTGPHTHTKREGYKTCACGYTFPYATVTKAPEPLKLTYTGQTQTLVTQGTAEGGEMLYSLEKDGYYGKTVPFGIVKTYTVYYMVRGDSGHLDTEPESVTVTIKPTKRLLDLTGLNLAGDITIDGVDYPIETSNDTLYVTIPETGDLFTYYGYKNIWASNEHSNYPTSMSVYAIERTPTGSTAREITELQDLLTYAGCSIRISGKQGIRMITALDEATKKALTGKGLAGYTLEEYGTVVSWTDALGNGSFLRLGESYARSNYAYRKGKADPVFARKNGVIQYTNVLVLENLTEADYDKDLTLRAYIRLRNTETGETVTLYGGTVTRSIYYVARQNADTYKSGTAGYKFVHKIIDAVENP